MDLSVWSGGWGLPSVDVDCLAALAYCKFSKAPVNVLRTNNPWKSPNGKLPCLREIEERFDSLTQIFEVLRKNNYGVDSWLSTRQSSDVFAFSAMLEEQLKPALLHTLWVDEKTTSELSRPWMARHLPWWLKFYWPGRVQREASRRIQAKTSDSHLNLTTKELEKEVYKHGRECLNLMEARMGQNKFFFGDRPSSLDAILFGYLGPLLKAPLPSSILQQHLLQCPHLVDFCERILKEHFPPTAEDLEEKQREEEVDRKRQEEALEFPHKKRNIFIAVMFALTAMVSYALMSGLVQVEITDVEDIGGEAIEDGDENEAGD